MATIGKASYKYCLVPCCTNTTFTVPDKLFLCVPKDRSKREAWTKAMKRDSEKNTALSTKTTRWCCEDHFSLEEDLENYCQWKLTGNVKRLKLKDGVVPHLFECQKKTLSTPIRKGALKRKHIALVQAALSAVDEPSSSFESEPSASTSFEEPSSKVCELHFEPSQILREASAYDPRTGRTLTARLRIPRLRQGAVPTIFMPPPGTRVKTRPGPKKLADIRQKNQPKEEAVKEGTEKTDESQLAKMLQTDLGTEFQNVAETSFVIKQEPDESVDEPPRLVIGKVLCAKELLSSSIISSFSSNSSFSSSSSSTSSISPIPENTLPIANTNSTNVDETPATHVSNKPAPKRNINNTELDANDATPDVSQAKLCRRAKPSMPSMLHPPAVTSKKSTGHFTFPTKNGENATREIFQSLVDGSENNPLFGSRTTERPGDLFDVFADFIADKLREMDWDDCAYALRAILDVIFKTGQVQHDSEIKSDISSPNAGSGSSDQE